MAITVLKNNVPWGPFTRTQIQEGLTRGDFTLQYLAHGPGLKEWLPLGEVLDHFDRGINLPPVPSAMGSPAVPRPGEARLPVAPPLPVRPPALPSEPPPTPLRSGSVEKPAPSTVRPSVQAPVLRAAPFLPRFFAFVFDCCVLFVPILFLFGLGALTIQIQGAIEHNDSETMHQEWVLLQRNFQDLLLMMALGGAWLYAALLECSRWQATVGKQWVGIKVTDGHGERLSFFRATGRHAAKFISAMPCFLGFTMALFSPRGLALHDRLAHTRVIRK